MKYIDEFRDGAKAQGLAKAIAATVLIEQKYRFMEFCGGHTHAIHRYGILDLLPPQVEMVHGPGCPVCVLPMTRITHAIDLAKIPGTILCSYGDMMRVPAADGQSLLRAKAGGADIRMVLSVLDALRIAEENPEREVIFFAIGFETTTPPTAEAIVQAHKRNLKNFSVFCNHVLTPPAITHILQAPEIREYGGVDLHGFIGPAHVSTVIGSQPYEFFAEEFHKPVVIAGFEPLDVLQAILMLIRQTNAGRACVENQFTRAVTPEGNQKAKDLMAEVFEMRRHFEWRGLGLIPYSALRIRDSYSKYDAEVRFPHTPRVVEENRACQCPAILRGLKKPKDCGLFATVCTPETPIGSCMVSSEGACAAYYGYGRFRD